MNVNWLHTDKINIQRMKEAFDWTSYDELRKKLKYEIKETDISFTKFIEKYNNKINIKEVDKIEAEITKSINYITDSIEHLNVIYISKIIFSHSTKIIIYITLIIL
jgi:hypothetical protein